MRARRLLVLAFPVLLLASLTACVPSVYRHPYPMRPVVMPRDQAAHEAPIEWWYYSGHLVDAQGRHYGFELTFFKVVPPPGINIGPVPAYVLMEKAYVGHFAVTDVSRKRFASAQRATAWGYQGGSSTDRYHVYVADWSAGEIPGTHLQRIKAEGDGYSIDLTLNSLKPPALHGEPPGIQSMGPGGTSYYVSHTRMAVDGTLGVDCNFFGCRDLKVTGLAWEDHQWGDFKMTGYAGWDWYSMQFDNDTELMLYLIRSEHGGLATAAGSFITKDGRTIHLTQKDFQVTATGATWTSPVTGAVYPVAWRVKVPRFGIDVSVTPVMKDQEMDTRSTTHTVYWEGDVRLTGSNSGEGYVELTNYDRYPYRPTGEASKTRP
ncbi:MAG: lipocalin-like domain-containing protein [Deinococcales bacterium]